MTATGPPPSPPGSASSEAYGSYEALLADPDVDAVYITVPNSLHHPLTMQSLAAGKHVLCEKPYTRHPEEVVAAFDAADAAGLILMEAFMWRHTPQAKRLVELLPEIGEVQSIRASFSFVTERPGQRNPPRARASTAAA